MVTFKFGSKVVVNASRAQSLRTVVKATIRYFDAARVLPCVVVVVDHYLGVAITKGWWAWKSGCGWFMIVLSCVSLGSCLVSGL